MAPIDYEDWPAWLARQREILHVLSQRMGADWIRKELHVIEDERNRQPAQATPESMAAVRRG